jgi:hypothetical protein
MPQTPPLIERVDADMTATIISTLEGLHLDGNGDPLTLLKVDQQVRDFLVDALRRNHHAARLDR